MSKRGLAEYIPHLIMHRSKASGAYSKMNEFIIMVIKRGNKLKQRLQNIELFYNQRRIQKRLDFKTPNQMAEDFCKLAA